MAYSRLPTELLLDIAELLPDPCDLHAFQCLDRNTYHTLSPIFSARYDFPKAFMVDYRVELLPFVPSQDAILYHHRDFLTHHHWTTAIKNHNRKILHRGDLLITARKHDWHRLAQLALKNAANPSSQRHKNKFLPLPLLAATMAGDIDLVALLLHSGARLADSGRWDWDDDRYAGQAGPALHLAVVRGDIEIVSFLLENGANPNVPDEEGYHALDRAARLQCPLERAVGCARLLLRYGGTSAGLYGVPPPAILEVASESAEFLELLLGYPCETLLIRGYQGSSEREEVRYDGHLVLHACIRLESRWGKPFTAPYANLESIRLLLERSVLCKSMISINCRNHQGKTLLMVAAEHNLLDAVKLLVDLGTDTGLLDNDGRTAYDLANDAGHDEVACYIQLAPPFDDGLVGEEELYKGLQEIMVSS